MASTETAGLLRADEVAERINASSQTVYALARAGVLPSIRWARAVRFEPEVVAAFIASHRRGGERGQG